MSLSRVLTIAVVLTPFVVVASYFGVLDALDTSIPDLSAVEVREVVMGRPEFSATRKVADVLWVRRGTASTYDCCSTASFTFTSAELPHPTEATADFRYWDKSWHLAEFHYGYPDHGVTIWIEYDRPNSK